MREYNRIMELDLPAGQSAFLWGARSTGKSTFLRQHYPESIYYDLLNTDQLHRLRVKPSILREELSAADPAKLKYPVIVDEVQKVPELLDEIHWLIENKKIAFILCGSSARKLKRGAANLLGGRAWAFSFYPLTYAEIDDFDLQQALNQGLIPSLYQSTQPARAFKAYVDLYLKEEIQAEGIVRNLPGFARFLDLVGFSNGELLNYKKIATDCGVDAKTIKEYYQILLDTLLGYYLHPFTRNTKRQIISSTPKFYLFDVGIGTHLAKRPILSLEGAAAGAAFEHYILMELIAYIGLRELNSKIYYWRSKTGLEVDFILEEGTVAVEVKISDNPKKTDYKGLLTYCEDHSPHTAIVVCQTPRRRKTSEGIVLMPWQEFLQALWAGEIIESQR